MDVLNRCGSCRGIGVDSDRPGVVEDEGNGWEKKFEIERNEVDGAGATGEEAGGVSQGEGKIQLWM